MAKVSLGPMCVSLLIKELRSAEEKLAKNEKAPIDLNSIVKKALKANKRWCVRMGQVAIKNELKALNDSTSCIDRAGSHRYTDMDGVPRLKVTLENQLNAQLIKEKKKFKDKDTDKKVIVAFKKGGNKLISLINSMCRGDKAFGKFWRTVIPPIKSSKLSTEFTAEDKHKYVISIGAGGFKAGDLLILKKPNSICKIIYPVLEFGSIDVLRDFVEAMIHVRLVPNSLFCFAGSARLYKVYYVELIERYPEEPDEDENEESDENNENSDSGSETDGNSDENSDYSED